MKKLVVFGLLCFFWIRTTIEVDARCYTDYMRPNDLGCDTGYTCKHQTTGAVCSDFGDDNCWCFPDSQVNIPTLPPADNLPPLSQPTTNPKQDIGPDSPFVPVIDTPVQACSADKAYEIIPSCVPCPDKKTGKPILFCYGNKYRLCDTGSQIPSPTGNLTAWLSPDQFPNGTVLYNSVTFNVPQGGVSVCDSNAFGCSNERCDGLSLFKAPIGYLDQMNVVAKGEISPTAEEEWYWAECVSPGNSWTTQCQAAAKKFGLGTEEGLHYPEWLLKWRDYVVDVVLPRRLPYKYKDEAIQKKIKDYVKEENNFPVAGWVKFSAENTNSDTKRTQATNPMTATFNAKYVGQLSYVTDWLWKTFTNSQDQLKKPILSKDGREPYEGYLSPDNGVVDLSVSSPLAGLFAADKVKGSCVGKNPALDCSDDDACSKACCKLRDPITLACLNYRSSKEDVWATRAINPDTALFDTVETLNPGWPELANTWNNLANPLNGFIAAIAKKYGQPIKVDETCDDLFGTKEMWQTYSQTTDRSLRPQICSWRYGNTPFTYQFAGQTYSCASITSPQSLAEAEAQQQCYAHWPFVGGLEKVYEFIQQFTNPFERRTSLATGLSGPTDTGVFTGEIKSEKLKQILAQAGSAFGVPASVLAGVMNFEGYHPGGPHMFNYTDEMVEAAAAAGGKDPYCANSPAGARGPMQFMPSQWQAYKNAVVEAGARPSGYSPEICNVLDAVYAAAKKLSYDSGTLGDGCACAAGSCATSKPNGVVWTKADVYHATCHYYGNCSANYCATCWQFYQNYSQP